MPSLIVDNIPLELYQQLQRRASARRRTVEDETVELLQEALGRQDGSPSPRLPDLVPAAEIDAPCDLPRPAVATQVPTCAGKSSLPDPLL